MSTDDGSPSKNLRPGGAPPAEEVRFEDQRYGQVRLRHWHDLHAQQDASTVFSAIRTEVHLERDKPPKPLWLGCQNAQDLSL